MVVCGYLLAAPGVVQRSAAVPVRERRPTTCERSPVGRARRMTTKRDDGGRPVVLVVPAGSGAMARSAQHLADAVRRVDPSVELLPTDVGACAHRFGARPALAGALTGLFRESVFVRSLRRCGS